MAAIWRTDSKIESTERGAVTKTGSPEIREFQDRPAVVPRRRRDDQVRLEPYDYLVVGVHEVADPELSRYLVGPVALLCDADQLAPGTDNKQGLCDAGGERNDTGGTGRYAHASANAVGVSGRRRTHVRCGAAAAAGRRKNDEASRQGGEDPCGGSRKEIPALPFEGAGTEESRLHSRSLSREESMETARSRQVS